MDKLHVHVDVAEAAKFAGYLLIAGYFIRVGAAYLVNSDNPTLQSFGKALAFIY